MRNWKIIAVILPVLLMSILFVSCYTIFNCPSYPESMAKFMPGQYSGDELKYLVGNDTCVLKVGKLSLSKAYKYKSDCGGDHCEITAKQLLGKLKDAYSIEYIQRYEHHMDFVELSILIGKQGSQKDIGWRWISYDFEDTEFAREQQYKILTEYVDPSGKIYSQVLFYHYRDSVWVSYEEGLIRYVPGQADTTALGQVWQLL